MSGHKILALAIGRWRRIKNRLRSFICTDYLLTGWWRWRVLAIQHLTFVLSEQDFILNLLMLLLLLLVCGQLTTFVASKHQGFIRHQCCVMEGTLLLLLLSVTQMMLTHASRSSCENSGTKVSGIPSAIWQLSPEGRRDSTWHRRLKRTTSPGPTLGDDTVAVRKRIMVHDTGFIVKGNARIRHKAVWG